MPEDTGVNKSNKNQALATKKILAKTLLGAGFLTSSLLTAQAQAYSGYIGGGIHFNGNYSFTAEYAEDTFHSQEFSVSEKFKTDTAGIQLKVGQYLSPSFAIELQAIAGLGGDTITTKNNTLPYETELDSSGVRVPADGVTTPRDPVPPAYYDHDVELKSAVALFAKPMIFINESAKIYGLLGYAVTDVDISSDSITQFENKGEDAGLAYGLGIEKEMEYGVFLSAEYVSLLDGSDQGYNALNVGLSMYVW